MNKDRTPQPTQSQTHTLFTKNNVITTKNYTLYLNEIQNTDNKIHNVYNSLRSADKDDTLTLRISSPGGFVTECQNIVNIMRNVFYKRTTSYIDSHASSAGAIIFLAADKRVIYKNSRIMIHNYSGAYFGTYKKMKTRINFDEKHVIGFLKSIINPRKKGFLSKSEFKEMIDGKEFWFRADEMLRRKIATHIVINGEELTAKEYLKGK